MSRASVEDVPEERVLYLTTIGRRTGLPREIEIWFVSCRDRFYLFAETGEAAGWVKNIRQNSEVAVRIGERQIGATARVLDREADRPLWFQVAALAEQKYGWGGGLPVEITPLARISHRSVEICRATGSAARCSGGGRRAPVLRVPAGALRGSPGLAGCEEYVAGSFRFVSAPRRRGGRGRARIRAGTGRPRRWRI